MKTLTLPAHPVDGFTVDYWNVTDTGVYQSTAKYFVNTPASVVFAKRSRSYQRSPPFVDQWLIEGWVAGRMHRWEGIKQVEEGYPRSGFWSELDALREHYARLVKGRDVMRRELARVEKRVEEVSEMIDMLEMKGEDDR